MKKQKTIWNYIGMILAILFFIWAFRVYSSSKAYRPPEETKFYYLQSGNNYRLIALDTDSTLWSYQTYYDAQTQTMAASRDCFSLSGNSGKHLFGPYYLAGNSWFSIEKAPYDTVPFYMTLECIDTQAINVSNPNNFTYGQTFTDDICISDTYFVYKKNVMQRVSADEIPAGIIIPLALFD